MVVLFQAIDSHVTFRWSRAPDQFSASRIQSELCESSDKRSRTPSLPLSLPLSSAGERKTFRLKQVSVAISVLIEVLNAMTRLSVSLSKYWISTKFLCLLFDIDQCENICRLDRTLETVSVFARLLQ